MASLPGDLQGEQVRLWCRALCCLKEVESPLCIEALMNSLQSSYHNLTGRTTAGHDGNQTKAAILLKHNVDFLCWGGTAERAPPVRHSTHRGLGAACTPYYFNKPLNPSARQRMKETDAEKSLRGKTGFVTDERKCLSLVNGAFQGLCAIVGPAGRRPPSGAETSVSQDLSHHRPTGAAWPTDNTLNQNLHLSYFYFVYV